MERKRVVALAAVIGLAAWMSPGASAQEKGGGPYGLPTFAEVKEKVKLTDDEAKKIEDIYAMAAKNEAESKARAKENGTDNKTLQGYLQVGKNETINKIKEVLDKEKGKEFDKLCAAAQPSKKKK